MPTFYLPYPVYGNITGLSRASNVTVHNTTRGGKTSAKSTTTQYLVDLANLPTGYSSGDSITIYIRDNGYTGETTFTVAGVGIQKDFTVYGETYDITGLRTGLWDGVYQTLQSGTYAISTDNIHAAMNQIQIKGDAEKGITGEGYPQVIIYIPVIETSSLDFDKKLLIKEVNFMIEIYHTSAESLKVLTDEIESKCWEAEDVWNGLFLNDLDMPDNDYDWWTENKKKIHRSTLNANFTYIGRR